MLIHESLPTYEPDVFERNLRALLGDKAADGVLERYNNPRQLLTAGDQDLLQCRYVGRKAIERLRAAMAIGMQAQNTPLMRGEAFTSSRSVWEHWRTRIGTAEQEHFAVLFLDNKNRIIDTEVVSKGSVSLCPLSPQEIFAPALRMKALRLILIHNHPSGNVEPSTQDRALTTRLQKIAKLLGLEIIDHIIISNTDYLSFTDRGYI